MGLSGLLRRVRWGPLRSLANAHVPFRLYRLIMENGGRRQSRLLALDAVSGDLDPYAFDRVPQANELTRLETRNCLPASLAETHGREIVVECARREVYRTGFFRVRGLQIRAELLPTELHIPYWIGFFGSEDRARLAVLDAVQRRAQGAKARAFFQTWLLS